MGVSLEPYRLYFYDVKLKTRARVHVLWGHPAKQPKKRPSLITALKPDDCPAKQPKN